MRAKISKDETLNCLNYGHKWLERLFSMRYNCYCSIRINKKSTAVLHFNFDGYLN